MRGSRNRGGRCHARRGRRATLLGALPALVAATATLAPAPAGAQAPCGDHPWCDPALSADERADLLLEELTLSERISLLSGGSSNGHTGATKAIPRVGLPPAYVTDGPVGVRQGKATALPVPLALAATFDRKLARLHGRTIGAETRAKGNDGILAPTVNIMRIPTGGRTFEGYGEDPFLSGRIATRWIRGAQSRGVFATVKHFAVNNQEGYPIGPVLGPVTPTTGSRFTVNAIVDERALREIYLPQFEAAVKRGHVGSVMCSYNRVNGPWACANEHLLSDILREEWGFDGFVMSDWTLAAHPFDVAEQLEFGLDLEMPTALSYQPALVNAALATGSVDEDAIAERVRNLLRTLFEFGFFDRSAYVDDPAQLDAAAHARAARRISQGAITLLRNRGHVLPLERRKLDSIALIGADADRFRTGGGSANVDPLHSVTPRAAITRLAGGGIDVRYDPGDDPAAAADLARNSDVALVFASDESTEGADKVCMEVGSCDTAARGELDSLIESVAAANPRTVVVLQTGAPVLTPWRSRVAGLVEAWYGGQEAGSAIAKVLFGKRDPAGRLPVTFPRSPDDLPTAGDSEAYPGVAETVRYKEGVFVGYRWFDERGIKPAYPFGFGRSYTRFSYSGLRVGRRLASVEVTNVGDRKGVAVPQLYVRFPEREGLPQPPRQLKGFASVSLRPHQSKRVRFPLSKRSFSSWDVANDRWRMFPGCYGVLLGSSSRHIAERAKAPRGGARCG